MDDKLSNDDFEKVTKYIRSEVGINITQPKKVMLETRLRKRMKSTGHSHMSDYVLFLFSAEGQKVERELFINAVTTNKTDFYREPHHFNFMVETAIPQLLGNRGDKNLRVWSAACSLGAEPYTLAIVLEEYRNKVKSELKNYSIFATDISTKVLSHAHKGIYSIDDIQPVPKREQYKYFMKSVKPGSDAVRVVPELRSKISFRHLNLMKPFAFSQKVDMIFCRNVMIYFTKETQINLVHRLIQNLNPGGYLFMGHSEVLDPRIFKLKGVAPSVYRKG